MQAKYKDYLCAHTKYTIIPSTRPLRFWYLKFGLGLYSMPPFIQSFLFWFCLFTTFSFFCLDFILLFFRFIHCTLYCNKKIHDVWMFFFWFLLFAFVSFVYLFEIAWIFSWINNRFVHSLEFSLIVHLLSMANSHNYLPFRTCLRFVVLSHWHFQHPFEYFLFLRHNFFWEIGRNLLFVHFFFLVLLINWMFLLFIFVCWLL